MIVKSHFVTSCLAKQRVVLPESKKITPSSGKKSSALSAMRFFYFDVFINSGIYTSNHYFAFSHSSAVVLL